MHRNRPKKHRAVEGILLCGEHPVDRESSLEPASPEPFLFMTNLSILNAKAASSVRYVELDYLKALLFGH
jgi:hypothetical protein